MDTVGWKRGFLIRRFCSFHVALISSGWCKKSAMREVKDMAHFRTFWQNPKYWQKQGRKRAKGARGGMTKKCVWCGEYLNEKKGSEWNGRDGRPIRPGGKMEGPTRKGARPKNRGTLFTETDNRPPTQPPSNQHKTRRNKISPKALQKVSISFNIS